MADIKSKGNKFKLLKSKKARIITILLGATLIVSAVLLVCFLLFSSLIYPGIYVGEVDLTALSKPQAEQKLKGVIKTRTSQQLTFKYKSEASNSSTLDYQINLDQSLVDAEIKEAVTKAFLLGHQRFYVPPVRIELLPSFNQELDKQIESINSFINQPPIDSQLKVEGDQINVTPSQNGMSVDKEAFKKRLDSFINTGVLDSNLPVRVVYPKLSYENGLQIKKRLDQIKLSPLKLKFKDQTYDLDLETVLGLIDLENTQSFVASGNILDKNINIESIKIGEVEQTDTKLTLNKDKIRKYLAKIALDIDREVEEPLFSFDPSSPNKVKEFRPPQQGQKLDIDLAQERISQVLLTQNQTQVQLPVEVTQPKNKLSNELGIKELVGSGVSYFTGSIPNRIFNIGLAASRINGVLIPPGEVFSFNNTVGDISAASGYKQAYVIKSGRTVLDDGGGVCQVSTTLFRTVLNAGLPVVKRTAHAYRVGYYEQGFPPGLDATIFHPSVDFQFKNDTPGHILIQAWAEGNALYVDFYGTPDGRIAKISKPIISNQTPPPPDIRQDDPTLPKGTVKQADFSAWGAVVSFNRTVTRGGETIINETFRSNYRPWQAVFLVGTGG